MTPFNETITIYNKYESVVDNITSLKWKKTILSGVNVSKTTQINNNGIIITNNITSVLIPYNKGYRPPTNELNVGFYGIEDKTNYFTLNVGDVIAIGNCSLTIADNKSKNEILNNYKPSFEIKTTKDNTLIKYKSILVEQEQPSLSIASYLITE